MMRTAATLAAIFIAVTAAVHFGYQHLEQKLEQMSCVPQAASQGGTVAADGPVSRPTAAPEPVAAPSAAPRQDFQIIVRRDIFQAGGGAAAVAQKPPEPEPVPEVVPTRLNLTLAGTVTGSLKSARAIVVDNATGKRKQLLLRVGDGVQGAVIKSIDWNKITLEVNGRLEELEMPKPNEKTFTRSAGSSSSAEFSPPPVQEQTGNLNRSRPPTRPMRRISLPELNQPADNAPDLPGLEMGQPSDGLPEELGLELPQGEGSPLNLPGLELKPPSDGLPDALGFGPPQDAGPSPVEGEEPQLPEDELLPPME